MSIPSTRAGKTASLSTLAGQMGEAYRIGLSAGAGAAIGLVAAGLMRACRAAAPALLSSPR